MIVFFARYPSDELLTDGMFRRIKEIDALFADRERLYVYPEKNSGTDYRIPPLRRVSDKTACQALDFRYAAHNLHFAQLVAGADMVYAHTSVHSAQYMGPYLETGKVICDAHGAAAEEWLMSGYPSCSRFWSPLEGRLVRESARVVVVTRAMADFYREKYGISDNRFIHIPIAAHKKAGDFTARAADAPPRIIYAGGTHPWQNVDLMLDAARDFPGEAEFIFLSGDRDTFQKKIAARHIPHKVTLRSVPSHEVDAWYARADFGFILRDDDPVNNVAFPTKLAEYMYSGVIPVIRTNRLGDIVRYGLEVVTLEQFLRGELPDPGQRIRMARKNLSVFSVIAEEYRQGTEALLSAVSDIAAKGKTPAASTQYPTFIQNAVFPIFFTCSYVADGVQHSRPLDCAEHPLAMTLEFKTPVTLSMLALDVSGRDFVFAMPEASFATANGDVSGPCANPSDFSRTAWGDLVYRSGWIYFACPDAPVSRVTLRLDVKLFEMETAVLSAPAGNSGWMLAKAWRVLRRDGVPVFCRKARGKARAIADKRFGHYGSNTSTILYNILKTHLPAPLKSALKGLRSRARQRRFTRESPAGKYKPSPVDVLFQVENFLAGGLENVVLDLLATFREAGMRVALLVLGQPGEAVNRAERLGLPVYIEAYAEDGYAKLLEAAKPGLLLTHYSVLGLKTAAQKGIPVIQVIHNSYIWFTEQDRADFQASAQSTDLFIAVSRWVTDYSIRRLGLPSEKVCVIENGIDLRKFQHPELAEEGKKLREELGFSKTDVLFLSVASIAQQKNPLGLARAFHAAVPTCPNAKLALLGPVYDPALYEAVMRYCSEHALQNKVFYLGTASNPAPYYAMADIFAHAAFFEGGQLSFLEALAMNLPCVSTAVGFCMNREEQPGLYICPPPVDLYTYTGTLAELAPTGDSIQALAKCVRKAYAERKRPSLSRREIETLDRKFSHEAYVQKIMPLMKKI
jgi:glycosyltransferase involved in cell wall biosynthesis